ncbi:MAG: hydrolase [Oscillibacter sp.]|nr:VanW family protein [uncultured Oscillibacter sp.]MCI8971636.1 hydrolase [Oscillibacter sp.]
MGQMINEAAAGGSVKKGSAAPVVIALALTAAIMAGAYAGLCYWAGSRTTFYPKETISGVNVGGLTVEQAGQVLAGSLPGRALTVSPVQTAEAEGWLPEAAGASITLGELGYTAEQCPGIAQRHFDEQAAAPFLSRGARVLSILTDSEGDGLTAQDRDEEIFREGVARLAEELAMEPVDGSFTVLDDEILLTKEANGRSVGEEGLALVLESAAASGETEVQVDMTTHPAQPLSIQTVHEAVSGEMENARYDKETGGILPEKRGASFETGSAQRLLTAAAPGETVAVPADIREPEITAEELKAVLFRDLLGECTTHVGGTAARVSNVKLASAAFDGTVLNSGDLFSYNETVGQRTEAKGYKAAPAYVQGETVDEIGGGVCQPSSTLYYACLLANMEITERYAHRYIPAYITRGMDATVSWGGPDYKFTNNTQYPVKITAKYDKGYLTVQLWGTRTDDLTVKMTYETLSTTPFEEVEQLDPSLASGQRQVKVTPYTGYRVKTYRNIFDGSGNLISSDVEAISDYKHRDRLVLVGPPKEEVPETGGTLPGIPAAPSEQTPAAPGNAEPSVPAAGPAEVPAEPEPPAEPAEPPAIVVIPPSEE